jgi:short-subunit dehydrogenase
MNYSFTQKYGPWGLVTGGARGIGKALAEQMAARGLHVIIVDVLEKEAQLVALDLSARFQIQTKIIYANLEKPDDVNLVIQACESYSIGLFCCNHASTHLFPDNKLKLWLDTSEKDLNAMLQINLISSLNLIYHFAHKMRSLKRGGIIITASGAAIIGQPYLAHYSATKAFLATLGTTLWQEFKREGIDMLTVLPGATNTLAATRFLNEEGKKKIPLMLPEKVAETAFRSLGKKIRVTPGIQNIIQTIILTILPRSLGIALLAKFIPRFFSVSTNS